MSSSRNLRTYRVAVPLRGPKGGLRKAKRVAANLIDMGYRRVSYRKKRVDGKKVYEVSGGKW